MTLEGTNTYLLGTGSHRILIDAGQGIDQYTRLLKQTLSDENAQIAQVLITHRHLDHCGGLDSLKNEGMIDDLCVYRYENVCHGQVFSVQGATVRVVLTPGHTDDHLSFWMDEENALFAGDCVLGKGTCVFEELDVYLNSLKMILAEFPALKRIYPGHGPVVENGVEKIQSYVRHREDREKEIILQFRKSGFPISVLQIVQGVYGEQVKDERIKLAAANNVIQHLKKLVKDEIVVHVDPGANSAYDATYFLKQNSMKL
jgi:glyoxylase-like metal-dependent hydrolase (beta-lactamase superfamily II)